MTIDNAPRPVRISPPRTGVRSDSAPLREIILGVARVDSAVAHFGALTDSPAQRVGSSFNFGAGPGLHVVESSAPAILGIVVQVRSLARARAFLSEHGLLGDAAPDRVTIAPAPIGGLQITLVQ